MPISSALRLGVQGCGGSGFGVLAGARSVLRRLIRKDTASIFKWMYGRTKDSVLDFMHKCRGLKLPESLRCVVGPMWVLRLHLGVPIQLAGS